MLQSIYGKWVSVALHGHGFTCDVHNIKRGKKKVIKFYFDRSDGENQVSEGTYRLKLNMFLKLKVKILDKKYQKM